jgi:hypothetical protein
MSLNICRSSSECVFFKSFKYLSQNRVLSIWQITSNNAVCSLNYFSTLKMYICRFCSEGANIELKLYAISIKSPLGFIALIFTYFIFTNYFFTNTITITSRVQANNLKFHIQSHVTWLTRPDHGEVSETRQDSLPYRHIMILIYSDTITNWSRHSLSIVSKTQTQAYCPLLSQYLSFHHIYSKTRQLRLECAPIQYSGIDPF